MSAGEAPRVGVGVIVVRDGRVLLGRRLGAHGAGTWSPPGGHLEFGETPEDGARRELAEETGLVAREVAPGPWVSNVFPEVGRHYVTLITVVSADGEPRRVEPERCAGWHWFGWDDLPEPLFAPAASVHASGWRPPGVAAAGAPLFAAAGLALRELRRDERPALQALFEANADYFVTVGGRPPGPDAAAEEHAELPPPALAWSRRWFAGIHDEAGRLVGVLNLVADLGTPGCWHVALFLLDHRHRGSGQAAALHAALERWAAAGGARWLRLGVVDGNTRAARFWRRLGYRPLRQRPLTGADGATREVVVMLKPLAADAGVDDYLARVPRDRPGSELP